MNRCGKILSSLSVLTLVGILAACESDEVVRTEPNVSECSVWEWEHDEGVWECEDPRSEYEDQYYANGVFYHGSSSKAIKSKSVKKVVDKVTKSPSKSGTKVKAKASSGKSGLGSGSKGSGSKGSFGG